MPEIVIVAAGPHRQGHGDAPTQQEHFLPGLETGQHAAQGVTTGISLLLQDLHLALLPLASEFLIPAPVLPGPP